MAKLLKTKVKNRLEIYLSYSDKNNERKLSILGYGKWRNYNENKL